MTAPKSLSPHHALPKPPTTLEGLLKLTLDDHDALAEDADIGFDTQATIAHAAGTRTVGVAGGVMARTLRAAPVVARPSACTALGSAHPQASHFPSAWTAALKTIEALGRGEWAIAWPACHGRRRMRGASMTAGFTALMQRLVAPAVAREIAQGFRGRKEHARWRALMRESLLAALGTAERSVRARARSAYGCAGLPDPPATLAAALELSLRDARSLLERADTDGYAFASESSWHASGSAERPCAVCAAGAVMARTLGTAPDVGANPETFPLAWAYALQCIDAMRRSAWSQAWQIMHGITVCRVDGKALAGHVVFNRATAAQGFVTIWEWDGRRGFERWLACAEQTIAPALARHERAILESVPG